MRILRIVIVALGVVAATVPAWAQTPWSVTFPPNPSHGLVASGVAVVERYEMQVTLQGGAPGAVLDLAKPAPVGGTITVNVDAFITKLAPGTYTAVIRAIGPGGSAVSPAGPPFSLTVVAPAAQGAPTVSKSGTALQKKQQP